MRRCTHNRLGLTLVFSLAVCLIFIVTALIMAAISYFAIRSGFVLRFGHYGIFVVVITLLVASTIVGTIVSFAIGSFPLKPIRKVIAAINQLAGGNFSTRLNITRPPEFKELSDSFNRMAAELGGIELLRTDFVNNFSHEFKTPIVSIKGFAEVLKREDLTPEERGKYLDIMIKESDRLASLATNVLNLSKIENQTILSEKRPFDLSEQIRRCILLLQSGWEQKQLALSVEVEDMTCVGNEELLDQVWLNLLDNAIKFTPAGGTISVALTRSGEKAQFILRDSGCGIDSEAMAHIFDRFYQAAASPTVLGNGLGLTVARKIVALHQGTIICHSESNQGCEFIVTLPLR